MRISPGRTRGVPSCVRILLPPPKILLPASHIWVLAKPGVPLYRGASCFLSRRTADDACGALRDLANRAHVSESCRGLRRLTWDVREGSFVVERHETEEQVWWEVVEGLPAAPVEIRIVRRSR